MSTSKTSLSVIIASIIVIIAGVMAAKSVILPFVLAVFISVICMQPISWLEKRKVPFGLAVFIVLMVVAMILILLGGIIGRSLNNFMKDVPKYEENLRSMFTSIIDSLNAIGADIDSTQLIDLIDPGKLISFTTGALGEIGRLMSDSFIILLITVFVLLEAKSFINKAIVVQKHYGTSLSHFNQIGNSIRHYLSIKTIISILTGLFIWFWLWLFGIDYAILWGVIAFLLNYIPSIGSIIAAVPTILLALVQQGVGAMIWTAVGYLIVNTVMGNVVEPRVMGKGLGLSTLVVFMSLIIWGFVFGPVGMFLSVPLTITLKIFLEQSEKTRWLSVLIGSGQDSKRLLQRDKDL
ncbi:AI-2E family transporter [Carboxylicivirga linearis]|uniref:AI-2E family transporter n=1 Tax=Carboxylicivirga linearis TaxID=1628157 RepID=A0ABS5K051_9BACT|nr:AI-2E family transporter [Carboxylicivirga linearis]MBS2099956.1 AI-2E family transporter [Carboxylicivirga linearis]